MGSPWNPTSIPRGWGVGGRGPGTSYIMREPAKPSKCQAARNYLLDEGDLIDTGAALAELGKEWDLNIRMHSSPNG